MRWCDSEAVHVGDTAREIRGKFEGFNVATRFGAFVLDSDLRQLTREGAEIHLTPKAFDLLMVLVAEAGRVVRKPELHQRLWPRTFVSDATLVSLVKELRRALDDRDSGAPVIRTAHGVGYAFIAPIERHAPQRAEVSCWIIAGGRRIPLHIGDNLIGRDPASAVCLDEAGVSPRHARIVVGERGALLEDLGSKNGTSVGKIPVTGQVPLQDGDQLHVGPNVIIYHASATRRDGEHLATERRSIAVLPFSDMSPQKDQEYFCEGIAEELIHTLAAIDGLQVLARSSSFQFPAHGWTLARSARVSRSTPYWKAASGKRATGSASPCNWSTSATGITSGLSDTIATSMMCSRCRTRLRARLSRSSG
jgi:DNA-binding winged helix-turn-helix (wHTH) protein